MGIPHNTVGVAERKQAGLKFISSVFGEAVAHIWKDNSAFCAKSADCALHKRPCPVPRPSSGVRVASCGLPCQPHSAARQKNGETARTGAPEGHPDYSFPDNFVAYLKVRRPDSFVVEQVPAFADCETAKGNLMWLFCKAISRLGYSVRVFTLDHGMFVQLPREGFTETQTIPHTMCSQGVKRIDWITFLISSIDPAIVSVVA